MRLADEPLSTMDVSMRPGLTAVVETGVEGCRELWSHLHHEVAALLDALLAISAGLGDHGLEVCAFKGEDHITDPLAVHVHPVPLIRKVLDNSIVPLGEGKDLRYGEAFYLWDARDKNLVPFDVLAERMRPCGKRLPLWCRA